MQQRNRMTPQAKTDNNQEQMDNLSENGGKWQ